MDLPPPSPPSPTLPSSPTLVAASDDLSASEIWDWGNLLDFAIEADDSLILPLESLDVPHLPSPKPLAPEVESPAEPPAAVGRSSRVRKRDPRLVCANYLAGRVPCSCPEVDEKALEGDEWEVVVGGKKRARAGVVNVGVRCQVLGCEADISELKGYHRRHRVCLRCANASSVKLDGEEKRYCQQCGKFHALLDFDEGKRSCRRKLERHNKRRRRKPADSNTVAAKENAPDGEAVDDVILGTDQTQEITIGSASKDVDNVASNMVIDGKTYLDHDVVHVSPGCLLPYCEQTQKDSLSVSTSEDALIDDRIHNPKSAISSTASENKSSYSSVCPTGRMSFKLYDWNPAEFPRRLRHQWLSSMPVELEGYIRPGCTILTIFIAMPPYMWDKLYQDGALHLKQLIQAPESLLLGRGNILIYLSNMIVHVLKDGTSLVHVKMEIKAPKLHFVYPKIFEAGNALEFFACGSNLDQPNLRFLVSFSGNYLVCDAYRVASYGNVECYSEKLVVSGNNFEQEIFRVTVKQTPSGAFGPAFIEVENESGISNFIPILIGDRQVCYELQSMQSAFAEQPNLDEDKSELNAVCASTDFDELNVAKQNNMSDLLLDIAWLLKEPTKDYSETCSGLLNIKRLNCILHFSMQNNLISVLKAINKYVDNMIRDIGFHESEFLTADTNFGLFQEYMKITREMLSQNALRKERTKLDSGHTDILETLQTWHVANTGKLVNTQNQVEERSNTYSEEMVESAPLVINGITRSKFRFLHLSPHWPCKYWAGELFFRQGTRTWPAVFVTATLTMCFVVCIILLNPHKVSDVAVHIKRCLPSRLT